MNCREITEQIEVFVLGGLEAGAEDKVREHINRCAHCREIEQQCRTVIRQLRDSSEAAVGGDDFVNSVMMSAAEEIEGAKASRLYRPVIRAASAAACLAAAISAAVLLCGKAGKSNSAIVDLQGIDLRQIDAGARAVPLSVADDIVLCGGSIYYLLEEGSKVTVAAVDSQTGRQIWRSGIESEGLITADERQIYCVAAARQGNSSLVAIDQESGGVVWRFSQPKQKPLEAAYMPIVLPYGRLCWVINSTIYVLSADKGQVLWSCLVDESSFICEPVILGDSLYAAGAAGLYRFDISSGQKSLVLEYDCQPSRWVRPLLAADENRICLWQRLEGGQSRLVCLERQSGKMLWTRALHRAIHLHIDGDRIYARNPQNVLAIDARTGGALWDFRAAGCGPVTSAAGKVFFVDMSDSGRLVALEEKTGSKVLDLASMPSCNKFVKSGQSGYLKTHDGVIHVIPFKS